jgi:hypothetical protein
MQHKPQKRTLSIRVSDELREFLDRLALVLSRPGGPYRSTSDVANMLLESAQHDDPKLVFEIADLRQSPSVSLLAIRSKWELKQQLSHAEWIFMSQYVQTACEKLSENPEMPSPSTFAVLLEALLAIRELRTKPCVGLDRYYLANLGLTDAATRSDRTFDPDGVPLAVSRLTQQLRERCHSGKPMFAGRNFHVALRDEPLADIVALNGSLVPYMETLFRLAARGHWIRERRPLHPEGAQAVIPEPVSQQIDGIRLSFTDDGTGGLAVVLQLDHRRLEYELKSYPEILEFSAMLSGLQQRRSWTGVHFRAGIIDDTPERPHRCYFCRYGDGVVLEFSAGECRTLRDSLTAALALPQLQPWLAELLLVYGDV